MIKPREDKLLYGWRDPVTPRPAATVILMRDGEHGLEILMTRRSLKASFAPGAYVFPGGQVDAADRTIAEKILDTNDQDQLADAAFTVAAIRESFEELGVLIARDATDDHASQAIVNQMNRSQDEPFAAQLDAHKLSIQLSDVQWFSHWITDRDLPKRFDTRFFIALMPSGQEAIADESEQFEPVWKNPAQALAEHEKGEFAMIFPTIRTLRQLLRFENAAQVTDYCQSDEPMWVSSPRGGLRDEKIARFTEDELPFGELEMVTPDGRIEHRLDWQHEAVPLLKHVIRITAPNPGRMTGPGTNTYIIGEPGNYTVIDPGPNEPVHIERIAKIVGSDLRHIICTHSHPDHYPGAAPLRDLVGNANIPILGRRSGPDFNPAWAFEPDQTLEDGDTVSCGDSTIVALHTPGHASNHVCLLLSEDGLLFSGDHILNGSTTVIDHPDGNMLAYMNALERLSGENLSFILPAHGHVIGSPYAEIERLIKHRLKRESKVVDALTRATDGTLDDLVLIAYDDVDKSLHPVAKRSLSAHLAKLVEEGRAKQNAQSWQIA